MAKAETYIFILAALLIGAAYYIGLSTDARTASAGLNSLLQTVTGRDANNQFANYPKGA